MAISEGPVQPKISPEEVTIAFVVLVLSSISILALPSSFNAGIEYARVVPSPNIPTRAKPWFSNSVTDAESQKMSSHALCAPFKVAGLKIRASD